MSFWVGKVVSRNKNENQVMLSAFVGTNLTLRAMNVQLSMHRRTSRNHM